MSEEIACLGVGALRRAYSAGDLQPEEVITAISQRIEALDPALGAFATLRLDEALSESKRLSRMPRSDQTVGPLHGIPVAIKELFDVADTPTSYGSIVFREHVPKEDAEAVARLRAAGAIIIGTTRTHEFAWGVTCQHVTLGGVRNPWNPTLVPGGSSGGSTAAVAAGMVPLAVGTDTGGSVRIPAAYCGIVGLKPTFGRISKRGVLPLAPTLDHVGVFARTEHDCEYATNVIAGYDDRDHMSNRRLPAMQGEPNQYLDPSRLRVAYPSDEATSFLNDDYREALRSSLDALSNAGYRLSVGSTVDRQEARTAFGKVQMAEAYHSHNVTIGTFPQQRDLYGSDVAERMDAASRVTVDDYLTGMEMRRAITRKLEREFESVDLILSPVLGGGPSPIDDPEFVEHQGARIEFRELILGYSVPQDLSGLPAVTICVGIDRNGVPIGMQLTAGYGRETFLMRACAQMSRNLGERGLPATRVAPMDWATGNLGSEGSSR
jgi:aspartyl-tRNA(Asn)/glutamyl-tRNA(Gln) amidotransferase subunit A